MASFSIVADVLVRGLDSFRKLAGATEDVEEGADDASKALDKLGDESKRAGRAAERASVDLEDAASKFRAMGESGTLAGDTLERFSVITSGPLGLAIGGAVVGFAALKAGIAAAQAVTNGLIASVQAYIDTSGPLQRAQSRLNQQFADFVATLGAAITGGEDFSRVMDAVGDVISDVTDFIADNSDTILGFVKTAASAAALMAKVAVDVVFVTFAPVTLAIDATVKALSSVVEFAAQAQMSLIELAKALPESITSAAGFTQESLDRMYRTANQTAGVAGKSSAAAFTNGYTATLAEGAREVQAAIDKINSSIQSVGGGAGRVRGRTGAAGGAGASAGADAGARTSGQIFGAGFMPPGLFDTVQSFAAISAQIGNLDPGNKLDETRAKAKELEETYTELTAALQSVFTASKAVAEDAFVSLASGFGQVMGELAAGEGTLRSFGDAMAGLAGQIASSFGRLFIQMGTGFVLINPGIGAGLIAAGIGLQTLSGFLGARSGSRGGGGGSARAPGTSAAREIAREFNRSLRPQGDGGAMTTNIEVVIGGRSIQPEMVAIVDDISRQRRSRWLSRRQGV